MIRFDTEDLRDVFGATLVELGERYEDLIVLDADLNTSTRSVLFKKRFPDRFVQCGVAEANLIAVAAGLAAAGFRTIPSTFAAFATRKALDQVFLNVCYPRLDVKIPGSYVGLTATECGPSHNLVEDIAVMRALPHIRVAAPGDGNELRSFMNCMMEDRGPVYFRVEKAEAVRLFSEGHRFEWGKASVLREGSDISLIGTGIATGLLLAAAEMLARSGISAEVIHSASIKPLDETTIASSARKTGAVLTCENGRPQAGFGGAVAECLSCVAPTRMKFVGVGDVPVGSGTLEDLLRTNHLTPAHIVEGARTLLGRGGSFAPGSNLMRR